MLLSGCVKFQFEEPLPPGTEDLKVPVTMTVSIPNDGPSTKAMADDPQIKNIMVAVFGGSGYFNEWVRVTDITQMATQNYDAQNSATVYKIAFRLTASESRLRLHFIANCPSDLVDNPPITGVSSQDLEDAVMAKIRSRLGDVYDVDKTNEDSVQDKYNIEDGYWAKVLLPYGVQMEKEITNGVEQPVLVNGNPVPTALTKTQFTRFDATGGIPFVRNFARIYLNNNTEDGAWVIDKFALAYAPAEGSIAPILSGPYTSDKWGDPVVIDDDDDSSTFFTETFLVPYPGKTLAQLTAAPFNYKGYSPANLALRTPADDAGMTAWTAGSDGKTGTTALYIYERTRPRTGQKATRIIIKAHKKGADESTAKYFPLDLVDSETGEPMAFLRNFTYTFSLDKVEEDSGKDTIAEAADATAADVSSSYKTQDLTEVSDGLASISVSYIDATYMQQGSYDLMFHFDADVRKTEGNPENNNERVTLMVGYNDGSGFTENATSSNGTAFASGPTIEKNNGSVVQYVRSGNGFVVATAEQIADNTIEKWGKITYTTTTEDRNHASAVNTDNKYVKGFAQTIRVIGKKFDNTKVYRDVLINLTPIKSLTVECRDKYIEETKGVSETVRVYIPGDLTRSMFPLQFKIEADRQTLNPVAGQDLPVTSGRSLSASGEMAIQFIKTLTRDEYENLPVVSSTDDRKYFECTFKSIVATSASSVYVANDYFSTAYDSFENYTQRLFTATSPGDKSIGDVFTFTFSMDNAHTGEVVWHDSPDVSSTTQVIPKVVTLTLVGVQPETNTDGTPVDVRLTKGVGTGVYLYHVEGTSSPNETSAEVHLVVGSNADNYSIKLSTSNISPNPLLYKPETYTGAITKSQVTGMGFTDAGGTAISQVLAMADRPVSFKFTYGSTPVPVKFKLTGLVPNGDSRVSGPDANGIYTFTPGSSDTAPSIALKTSDDSTDPVSLTELTVVSEDYNQPATRSFSLSRFNYTISLPGTLTISRGGTADITATVGPTGVTTPTITWESNSTNVTIGAGTTTKTLTGANVGTATITAKIVIDGQKLASATCEVTVVNAVTLNTNSSTFSATGDKRSYSDNGITITFGRIQNIAANYVEYNTNAGNNNAQRRRFTVSTNVTGRRITKITLTFERQNGTLSVSTGNLAGNVWTGDATSIQFNNTQTTNNNRLSSVVVEYE